MLFIFMGQICTGKLKVAKEFKKITEAKVYEQNDYIKFSRNERKAWEMFYKELKNAEEKENDYFDSTIYIVSDINILNRLSGLENAVRIKFVADINIIKSRIDENFKDELGYYFKRNVCINFKEWLKIDSDVCVDTTEEKIPEEVLENIFDFMIQKR